MKKLSPLSSKFFPQLLLGATIASGAGMAAFFNPNLPFESYQSMRHEGVSSFFRAFHQVGATFLFLIAYYHMGKGLLSCSYRGCGKGRWLFGLGLFWILMGLGFTGFVLPSGQMSFWSANVILNLLAVLPLGEATASFLRDAEDNPHILRLFVLHGLLALLFAGLFFFYRKNRTPQDEAPRKRLWVLAVFLFAVFAATLWPDLLGDPENNLPADPFQTPEHLKPEWFFLPFYGILRSVTGGIAFGDHILLSASSAGALLMFGAAVMPVTPLWLESAKLRTPKWGAILLILDWLALAALGALPPDYFPEGLGQAATSYYYFYFLVFVPLSSRLDLKRWRRKAVQSSAGK
jgi:ubiquinol-cytochrome c reductase cytochrome b subunit